MRFGITILPEYPWREAAPLWRRAEELGFDHAWTYDHVMWSGLRDAPWYGTTPTLTAAALVTSTIRLGTFVASPNYRHPVPFFRDVLALDEISGGRFICGIGSGGTLDAAILHGAAPSLRERVDRFVEFTDLLDRLLTEERVTSEGQWFSAYDVSTAPGCIQRPRVPFVVAANGPRAMGVVARHGAGWVTTGPANATDADDWWNGVEALAKRLDEVLTTHGRDPQTVDRYLSLDSGPEFSLDSVATFSEAVRRADQLGFGDVIAHWPRTHDPDGPYSGDVAVLERVAAEVLPAYR